MEHRTRSSIGDTSVRSPAKLIVFVFRQENGVLKYPKNIVFDLENNITARYAAMKHRTTSSVGMATFWTAGLALASSASMHECKQLIALASTGLDLYSFLNQSRLQNSLRSDAGMSV